MLVSMKECGLGWDGVGLRQCDEGGDDAEGGEEFHCSCDVVISYLEELRWSDPYKISLYLLFMFLKVISNPRLFLGFRGKRIVDLFSDGHGSFDIRMHQG